MTLVIPTPQKPRRVELATFVEREEAKAYDANIYPGMLIELTSLGLFRRHSTEGGFAVKRFALEEALVSRNDPAQAGGVANIDTAYASGALVGARCFVTGDRVNALLKAGANYPIGSQLISDGAGRLILASAAASTGQVKQIIAEVDEIGGAVDLSGTGAVDTHHSVRVF
jgi:hypothetical protein